MQAQKPITFNHTLTNKIRQPQTLKENVMKLPIFNKNNNNITLYNTHINK